MPENPYKTTDVDVCQFAPLPDTPGSPWLLWIVVVLINLPLPLFLGNGCSRGFARMGMPIGIVLVGGVGVLLCGSYPRLMRNLSRGAVLTAISQVYPILHIAVGFIALWVCGGGPMEAESLQNVFRVLGATLITGVGLIIPSLAVGCFFAAIGSWLKRRPGG